MYENVSIRLFTQEMIKKIRVRHASRIITHVKEQESLSFKPVMLSVQEKEMNLGVLSCTYAVGLKS